MSSKWPLPFRFFDQNFVCISFLPCRLHSHNPSWLDHHDIIWGSVQNYETSHSSLNLGYDESRSAVWHFDFCLSPWRSLVIRLIDTSTVNLIWLPNDDIRGCIQKFPDCPPGARTASGTAVCH
jgi:hypothetical protein